MRQLIRQAEIKSSHDDRIVFTLDADGRFKFINEAAERLTGYSCAEALRLNACEIVGPACARNIREYMRRSLRRRIGTVFEIEVTSKQGRQIRLETSMDLVRRADRSIEFQGIALAQNDEASMIRERPRCLDERFAFAGPPEVAAALDLHGKVG